MIDTQQQQPVAVPQPPLPPAGAFAGTPAGSNGFQTTLPPEAASAQDDQAVFDKLYAERQARIAAPPIVVRFAGEVLRIYRHTPASAVFDALGVERDPDGIRRALHTMVVRDDREKLETILARDGDDPGSVDDEYIGEFLEEIAKRAGGRPLGG